MSRRLSLEEAVGIVGKAQADRENGRYTDSLSGALLRETTAVTGFRGGTNFFRFCGVEGTATDSPDSAVRSWLRVARRKLDLEK